MIEAIIYKATCLENGKSYIGFTADGDTPEAMLKKRRSNHMKQVRIGNGMLFHRAIRKYGEEAFQWEIIWKSSDRDRAAEEFEPYFIKMHKTKAPNGYNNSDGGGVAYGYRHTDAAKEKMRRAKLGKKMSAEHRRKTSAAMMGHPVSAATREKIRRANKGTKPWNTGKKRSAEDCRKISEGRKGIVFTEEHRKNMSLAQRRRFARERGEI